MPNEQKSGSSLVWDEEGRFRQQTWKELKNRIVNTQGGIGVIADDFREMLRYKGASIEDKTQAHRDAFADLTREACEPEDIELLSEILNYMLRDPWAANLDGAWFIYYLESKGTRDIDLERGASVINRLHDKNFYATSVLCETLSSFVYGEQLVIDQLLNAGTFSTDVINQIKSLRMNPTIKGERALISYPQLFLSYSRCDDTTMRKVRASLSAEGFKTWSDEMIEVGTSAWQKAIEKAIRESGAIVVILTPSACESEWVSKERAYASMLKKPVFPILAEGNEATSVPIDLATVQRADIRNDYRSSMSQLAHAIRQHFVRSPNSKRKATDTSRPIS